MTEMINSYWKPITSISDIKIDTLIYFWETNNGVKTDNIQFLITSIKGKILTIRKMTINGTILPDKERQTYDYSIESLVKRNAKYLYDEINDKAYWPKELNEAIKTLLDKFDEKELNEIRNMTWQQFQNKYNTFGGLGLWIRNYFGLWRGNFDLLINCKIDDINSDNATMSILYHFWEFIVYEK